MPNMQLCPNGHYFDSERYIACPYCKAIVDIDETGAFGGTDNISVTEGIESVSSNSANHNKKDNNSDDDVTVGLDRIRGTRIVPVVGWLVCTEGNDKGKDFRLHAGNNFVGRNSDRDVYLHDQSVSRKHFTISYDQRKDRWFITMGEGKEIVYVNDDPIGSMTFLKRGDLIEVANTKLVFIPLEQEYVKWEW